VRIVGDGVKLAVIEADLEVKLMPFLAEEDMARAGKSAHLQQVAFTVTTH
jgi:hypothetical protein